MLKPAISPIRVGSPPPGGLIAGFNLILPTPEKLRKGHHLTRPNTTDADSTYEL